MGCKSSTELKDFNLKNHLKKLYIFYIFIFIYLHIFLYMNGKAF